MKKKYNLKEMGNILIPEKIFKLELKNDLEKLYEKYYFKNFNFKLISYMFFLSIFLTIISYIFIYPYIYISIYSIITKGFLFKLITIFITYLFLNIIIYLGLVLSILIYIDSSFKKNQSEIEKNLVEFLDSLVSNLKGGLSLEKSMLKSVRVDQKALKKEIVLINQKIMMGKTTLEAFREFRERYSESAFINRTFFLMEEGMKEGGDLAAPLGRIAENVKKIYLLEDEIKSNAGGFAIIIKMITMVVAPLLFALALTLLTFIGNLLVLLSEANVDSINIEGGVPPEFFIYLSNFSYSMLILIVVFSSLISSQLKNEKVYNALKSIPTSIIIVIILFTYFSNMLLGFFGNII